MLANGYISVSHSVPLAQSTNSTLYIAEQYKADINPNKIDVSVGLFRTDELKPYVLPAVKQAIEIMFHNNKDNINFDYIPTLGIPSYTQAAARLILGHDSPAIRESRIATVQTISGTGALHTCSLFLSRFYQNNACYIPSPSYVSHRLILSMAGLQVKDYPYWDAARQKLDYTAMIEAMNEAPRGSIFLLHASGHNPTGTDPTQEQWQGIAQVMRERNHFPFFDCAYQGLTSSDGDVEKDAWAVRYFVEQGFEVLIAQSFSKNFGLYCERAGNLTIVTKSTEEANCVSSQLENIQRAEILNAPAHGARIVDTILNEPALYNEWRLNLKYMANRIASIRRELFNQLTALGTPGCWKHIVEQAGMFSFIGLTEMQVEVLKDKFHIYMMKNGRISITGLSIKNVGYFAQAVDYVVRNV